MRASTLFPKLKMPPDTRPEGVLIRAVLDLLRARSIPAWRQNVGGAVYKNRRGQKRFVRFGPPGLPDVLAVLPGSGRLLAVEAKRKPNRPSPEQAEFLDMLRAAGAVAITAYSVADVQEALAACHIPRGRAPMWRGPTRPYGGLKGVEQCQRASSD